MLFRHASRPILLLVSLLILFIALSFTADELSNSHKKTSGDQHERLLESKRKLTALQRLTAKQFRAEVCSKLTGDGMSSIKCAPEDHSELHRLGKSFVEKNGQPALLSPVVFVPGIESEFNCLSFLEICG
jgi:hypothetical protein